MPARIRITHGPDKGHETVLTAGEVRIGRGAGCQFVVTDEGFNGQLRVYFQGTTYWVSNETEGTANVIALNPQTKQFDVVDFPPGSKRVWNHGFQIQPTNSTKLVLTVEEADGDPDADGGDGGGVVVTRARTPEEEKKARDKLYMIVTGLCLPLALLLFVQPPADSGPVVQTRGQVSREFDAVSKDLEALKDHPKYGRSAAVVRGRIRDARLDEVGDRPKAAYDGYQQARDELDRALGDRPSDDGRPAPAADPDPTDDAVRTLRAAREFAAARLVLLGRAATRPR